MRLFRQVAYTSVFFAGMLAVAHADVAVAPDTSTVATIGSVSLTEQQMMEEIKPQLGQIEHQLYQIKRTWIDQKSKEALFTQAAAASGLSLQDWQKKNIDGQVPPVTQEEIDKTVHQYFANQPNVSSSTIQQVTTYLTQQKRQAREQALFQELKTKTPIIVHLQRPAPVRVSVAYAADDPVKGAKNAPVTLVEFTDYQCPYCKSSQSTLKQVEEAYKGKLKVVTREFPLPMHSRAKPAAEAALCALEQGKFWPVRDKLFASQTLTDDEFKQFAKDSGLNMKKFNACVADHRTAPRVEKDIADGQRFGVSGTPAFFINGEFINGAQSFAEFQEAVEDALAHPESMKFVTVTPKS